MAARTLLALVALGAAGCGAATKSVGTGAGSTPSTTFASAPTSGATSGATIVAPPHAPNHGGSATSTVSAPVLPPPTAAKPLPITRAPVLGVIQLTSADSSSTFEVRVGQSVQVTLSDQGMQWGPVQDTPAGLLTTQASPAAPAHGQLVVWKAASQGTVKVTAVGTAYCPAGTACPMFARLFEVMLAIS